MRPLRLPPSHSLRSGRWSIALPVLLLMLFHLPMPTAGGSPPSGLFPAPTKPKTNTPPLRRFQGRLDQLDLVHHPMTLTAVMGAGDSLVFLFGGRLIPDTMVLSDGRAVGVKALIKGESLEIFYRETPKGVRIRKILLLSAPPNCSGNSQKGPGQCRKDQGANAEKAHRTAAPSSLRTDHD